jgi:hypothetical protein
MIQKLINHFTEKQKTLFFIDGIGAFVTALSLFIIAQRFNDYFGMPKNTLTYLSVIAVCFCIYSISCAVFLKEKFATFIRIIAFANIVYCVLIIGLIIHNYSILTLIGKTYFFIEILIIGILSYVELSVAKRNKIKS